VSIELMIVKHRLVTVVESSLPRSWERRWLEERSR
jgi:hypothetical protein